MANYYESVFDEEIRKIEWVGQNLVLTFKPRVWLHLGTIAAIQSKFKVPESRIMSFRHGILGYVKKVTIHNLRGD